MQPIDIRDAKLDLPALLDAAIKGADIMIMQDSQPFVRLSHAAANGQSLVSGTSEEKQRRLPPQRLTRCKRKPQPTNF